MNKVNTTTMAELTWCSPKGKFSGAGKEISEALGRKPESTDLNERHPFDVEILRIPPGKAPYSYHSHSAQWEFYHVISGSGGVRHKDGTTPIEAGDAFIFKPGEPHQITNDTTEEDRKSTRLNSSHGYISYAVFCLKKKKTIDQYKVFI